MRRGLMWAGFLALGCGPGDTTPPGYAPQPLEDAQASADIARLRALHVELDQAVAAAYGWRDLDLGHGFHATKQGERYTLSEPARRTVLDRLLALNHHRYAEELKAGLHEKKKSRTTSKRSTLGIHLTEPEQRELL